MDDDRFESAGGMLRSLIAERIAELKQITDALEAAGEIYPLPKPADGLPEQWPWGTRTGVEVSKAVSVDTLRHAAGYLREAETDIANGKLARAIHRYDMGVRSLHSALAGWSNGSAVRMWTYVQKRRATNKSSASGDRNELKPNQVDSFRREFIKRHGKERGWIKAAALHFGVDPKTIATRRKT